MEARESIFVHGLCLTKSLKPHVTNNTFFCIQKTHTRLRTRLRTRFCNPDTLEASISGNGPRNLRTCTCDKPSLIDLAWLFFNKTTHTSTFKTAGYDDPTVREHYLIATFVRSLVKHQVMYPWIEACHPNLYGSSQVRRRIFAIVISFHHKFGAKIKGFS